MTNVLFDHQIFYKVYGGASKYFVMLLTHLPDTIRWQTSALVSMNEYVRAHHLLAYTGKKFKGEPWLLEHLNRPYTNLRLRMGRFDVFHQTDFGTFCLNSIGKKPMVTTFHDTNLSTFDPHPEIVERQRKSLERADAIVVVSENTKQSMLQFFDVDERKVHVIYHGIEMPSADILSLPRAYAFPYILYVGRRSEYKNFRRFIEAFAQVHRQHPDLHVVCTSLPFSAEENALFGQLGISDKVHRIFADEDTMKVLYRDAECFVFPSIYEGFGMPILEAWCCHCPVVLSNASCFPEIAGEAGLFFAPEETDDMAAKMTRIIEDRELRQSLVGKGNERVKLFSWDSCARKHQEVYESLA